MINIKNLVEIFSIISQTTNRSTIYSATESEITIALYRKGSNWQKSLSKTVHETIFKKNNCYMLDCKDGKDSFLVIPLKDENKKN